MFGYVKWVAIGSVMLGLSACATLGSLMDGNETSKTPLKDALCADAKLGMLTWAVMQDDSTDPEAMAYWAKYKKGLDLVLQTYCLGGD